MAGLLQDHPEMLVILDELERRDLVTGLIAVSGATGIGGALIVERAA